MPVESVAAAIAFLASEEASPRHWRPGDRVSVERYAVVIVGGGAAGINALKAARDLAATVALIERGPLGGTCINRG